jgi:hypothetical protein
MLAIMTDHSSWGGVDVLTRRFAEFLRDKGVDFTLVANGPSRLQAEATWARVITTDELARGCRDRTIEFLYFPTISMLRRSDIRWKDLGETRIFTLIVQPYEPLTRYVPALTFSTERIGYNAIKIARRLIPKHISLIDALFRNLADNDSLGVMDDTSTRALDGFFPDIKRPKILPIPTPVILSSSKRNVSNLNSLSVAYLGRLDVLKWTALQPIVTNELKTIAKTRMVSFHVVAEGERMESFAAECTKSGIAFNNYGYLPNAEARNLLAGAADIGLAMGTSALDLAGAGLPCIMIDPSFRVGASPQRLFHFVHETRGHSLGEYRDFPGYQQYGRTFSECIDLLGDGSIAEHERTYVREQHSPTKCFQATLDAIFSSRFTGTRLADFVIAIEASFGRMGRWYRWAGTGGRFGRFKP